MPYDPQRHHRRSIRLPGYDYTQPGAYFITIVTHERMLSFGEIVDGEMRLNEYGQIVRAEWFQTAVVRPYVVLHPDEFVVMPNHVHGIVSIVDMGGMDDDVGAQRRCAPTTTNPTNTAPTPTRRAVGGATPTNVIPGSLGAIVRSFKSATTKRINALRGTPGAPVWQRNYYEHIIRTDHALARIRDYIQSNPQRWADDQENPSLNRRR
jgi:REP element-mobilizing transposase RayT